MQHHVREAAGVCAQEHPAGPVRMCGRSVLCVAAAALALTLTQAALAKTVTVGSGSGFLSYPNAQATLNLAAGDTLYINAGTYSGLSIGNLAGTQAAPITVQCRPERGLHHDDATSPTSSSNLAFVTFRGLPLRELLHALPAVHRRQPRRAVQELPHDEHRAITASASTTRRWSSTARRRARSTTSSGRTWSSTAPRAARPSSTQNYSISDMTSMLLDFEIVDCTFSHFDYTTQSLVDLAFDKCFNLKVHDCTFSDIGMPARRLRQPHGHDRGSGYGQVYNNDFARRLGRRRAGPSP